MREPSPDSIRAELHARDARPNAPEYAQRLAAAWPDLDKLRVEEEAAWRADELLPRYADRVLHACSYYIPALEAEVERLRGLLAERGAA